MKYEVFITADNIKLRSKLNTNKTTRFTKKSFFYTILGFIESHSGPLSGIEGFIQLIPCKCQSNKPINFTGVDRLHLKCDCINGSNVNGVRETILYSFGFTSPPGHKI